MHLDVSHIDSLGGSWICPQLSSTVLQYTTLTPVTSSVRGVGNLQLLESYRFPKPSLITDSTGGGGIKLHRCFMWGEQVRFARWNLVGFIYQAESHPTPLPACCCKTRVTRKYMSSEMHFVDQLDFRTSIEFKIPGALIAKPLLRPLMMEDLLAKNLASCKFVFILT